MVKTIIARFTEMKKSMNGIATVDGEEISINKVDAALASAGVSLKNANNEFRDLDDVLLELASKWNSLDIMTQRYIATTAAGSRQQSRFIAMLQDYDRTMELVDAAYNSAGSSSKQFEKTQESLESMLARLQNAWNDFLMGIADDKIVKFFVNALTGLISAFNSLTKPMDGVIGSAIRLGAVFGGLRLANAGIQKAITQFVTLKRSVEGAEGAYKSLSTIQKLTQKINNFSLGKSFAVDSQVDTKGFKNKIETMKSDWAGLKKAISKGVPVSGITLGFQEIDGAMAVTSSIANKTGKQISIGLSEAGNSALLASDACQKIGENLTNTGLLGSEALSTLQTRYNVLTAQAKKFQALANESGISDSAKQRYLNAALERQKQASQITGDIEGLKELGAEGAEQYSEGLIETLKKRVSKVGTTITGGLSKLASAFGASGAVAGGFIAVGIVAAVAAVAGTIYAIWYNSAEQVAKRAAQTAQDATEGFSDALEKTKSGINDLKKSWDDLGNSSNNLNGLIKGTLAWKEALLENNELVDKLKKKYPDLVVTVNQTTGAKSISEDSYNKILEQQLENQAELLALENLSDASQGYYPALAEYEQAKSEFERREEVYENAKSEGIPTTNLPQDANTEPEQLAFSELEKAYNEQKVILSDKESQLNTQKLGLSKAYQDYVTQVLSSKYSTSAISAVSSLAGSNLAVDFAPNLANEYLEKYRSFWKGRDTEVKNDEKGLKRWAALNNYTYKNKNTVLDSEGNNVFEDYTHDDWIKLQNSLAYLYAGDELKKKTASAANIINKMGTGMQALTGRTSYGDIDINLVEPLAPKNSKIPLIGKLLPPLGIDKKFSKDLSQATLGSELYNKNISDIEENSDEANFLELITGKTLKDLQKEAKNKTKTVGDIYSNYLVESAAAIKTKISETRKGLGDTATDLTDQEILNIEQIKQNIETSFGDSDTSGITEGITNAYAEGISKLGDDSKLKKAITDATLDLSKTLSSPLQTKALIKKWTEAGAKEGATEIEKGLGQYGETLENMLSDNLLSASMQLKEVLTSTDFAEVATDLAEIYKETGRISFDDIKKGAEDSASLAQMLENGDVSATGFAKAMELVNEGILTTTQLSDGWIEALTEAYQLMDNLDEAYERMEEYDFGKSYTDIGDSYKDAAEAVQKLANGGAWGDPQFDKYMEYIVGQERWAKLLQESNGSTELAYNQVKSTVEGAKGTLLSLWRDALKNSNVSGADKVVTMQGGLPVFDLKNIKSTEDLVEKVAKQLGKTKDEARAMVADASVYSDELSTYLELLDKAKALQTLLNKRGNAKVTRQDLESLGINEEQLSHMRVGGKKIELMTDEEADGLTEKAKTAMESALSDVDFSNVSVNGLQDTFDEAVSIGLAQGLSLDGAKEAAIEYLKIKTGDKMTDGIAAGLMAGYQDEAAKVAAKNAANEQARTFYVAIYSAIINAMADAFGAQYGFNNPSGVSSTGNPTYKIDENTRWVLDENNQTLTKEKKDSYGKWVADGNDLQNHWKDVYLPYKNQKDAAENAVETATEKAKDMWKDEDPPTPNGTNDDDNKNEIEVTLEDILKALTGYGDSGEEGINKSTDKSDKDNKDKDKKLTSYDEENANKQLDALERLRETNDREAELIDKLPEEIQFPLKMANLGEDMFYEYQEIQINKNKLAALESQKQMEQANAEFLNKYYYFDELLGAYMYNVDAMNSLSDEERDKVEEEINSLQELQDKINEVNQELDGGKIQKIFRGLAKVSTDTSKALKGTSKASDMLEEEFGDLADKFGLGDQLDKFGKSLDSAIDESKFLKKEFKGLGIASEDMLSKIDSLPFGDATKSLIKNTLGTNENGTIGSFLGDSFGAAGEMFDGLADVLNFDMMSMGLDAFNNMKDMASKIIQQVVSVIQTVVSWWTNREDWLYNLLSAIEQEVHNFNRQDQVEERFRLYSDEGLNDLVSAWEAMRASLEKQIDLNEQLIKSRQAELQFLNLTNLPFSPAFYYDYKEERVIENPWVYDIYVLLLDLGSMIPEIGGVFSSIKQLMEDNKKRMEEAVDEIESAREQILELEKQQLELRTKYMEDEEELEQLVMDAIIEKQQEEIDELTAMSDAISEGNQKLIDALNDNLDKIRDMRDNQDREEELAQKERRLAYLRQDTSGANRAQILDLQKELEDERRDYTDTLIDQKISELEKQNEDAAEQRQKQIDLLQEQLDYTEKYGLQWKEAQTLIKNGFDNEGRLRVGSELFDLLMSKEDFTSLGNGSTRQNRQIMDWNVTGIAAAAYREIHHIWEKGFGNFEMSNDVHDQSRLHLWEDRDIEYRQLPSWLSFLQPAYNSIQDYAWRTKQNLGSFVETGYLSGPNSSSILGKTIVPLVQKIAANIEAMVNDYKSISEAETGGAQTIAGVITSSTDNLGLSLGEKILSGFSKSISTLGDDIISGVKVATQSNSSKTVTSTQNYGDIVFNNHFDSEENGDSIIERMVDFFRRGNQGLSVV